MKQIDDKTQEVVAHVFAVRSDDTWTSKATDEFPTPRNFRRFWFLDIETGELDNFVVDEDRAAASGVSNLEASQDLPSRWDDHAGVSLNPCRVVFKAKTVRRNVYWNFDHIQRID